MFLDISVPTYALKGCLHRGCPFYKTSNAHLLDYVPNRFCWVLRFFVEVRNFERQNVDVKLLPNLT
jgi:hypothetical protein